MQSNHHQIASLSFTPSLSFYSSTWQLVEAISRAIAFVGERELSWTRKCCMIDAFLMREMLHKKAFSGQLALSLSLSFSPSFSHTLHFVTFLWFLRWFIIIIMGALHLPPNVATSGSCNYQVATWLSLLLPALAPCPLSPLLLLATLQLQPAFPSNFTAILLCVVDSANVLPANLFPPLLLLSLCLLWQT